MRKEFGWKWYYFTGLAKAIHAEIFKQINRDPILWEAKSIQRTLFLLFEYNNCFQTRINVGLGYSSYKILLTEITVLYPITL